MPRIAVGGFHHETNCFVEPSTDFQYFAEHRDRPPLVRGPEVIEWLGNTSFALSGFMSEMGACHEYVPLVWTSGGAGGTGDTTGLLKSTVHFRADFEPIAHEVLVVVAPGGHVVDPTKYPYKRLRRGVRLYPLGPEFAGQTQST